jgi:hypothetical protein
MWGSTTSRPETVYLFCNTSRPPRGSPILLVNGYQGSLPWGKAVGAWRWSFTPIRCQSLERVEVSLHAHVFVHAVDSYNLSSQRSKSSGHWNRWNRKDEKHCTACLHAKWSEWRAMWVVKKNNFPVQPHILQYKTPKYEPIRYGCSLDSPNVRMLVKIKTKTLCTETRIRSGTTYMGRGGKVPPYYNRRHWMRVSV